MDNLILEIAKRLEYYNKNGLIIDEDFIRFVYDKIIKIYSINDYAKNLIFNDSLRGTDVGQYHFDERNLYISIEKACNTRDALKRNNLNEREMIETINLSLIGTVIHELTHALQYKKCVEDDKDICTDLLKTSLEKNLLIEAKGKEKEGYSKEMLAYFKGIKEEAKDLYGYKPSERMAYLKEYECVFKVCEHSFDSISQNVKKIYESLLLITKGNSYTDICPTAYYKSKIEVIKKKCGLDYSTTDAYELDQSYRDYSDKNNLSLDTRLLYGFPVDESALGEIKEKIKKLNR